MEHLNESTAVPELRCPLGQGLPRAKKHRLNKSYQYVV
jgi:hypothetical protein